MVQKAVLDLTPAFGGLGIVLFPLNFQVPHGNVRINLQVAATLRSLTKNVPK